MPTPPKYAPVVLPHDAHAQIERALLGRTNISGAAAVMNLLLQWPSITPPRPPRTWTDADTQIDTDVEHITAGGHRWFRALNHMWWVNLTTGDTQTTRALLRLHGPVTEEVPA